MDKYLDFWNLMTYDFAGSWDDVSGHQANVFKSQDHPEATPFDIDSTVQYYTGQGVAHRKIVLGMPLYGRAFLDTDGPGTSFNGVGPGSWEEGVFDAKVSCYKPHTYQTNAKMQALPQEGAQEYYDANAIASWSYDRSTRKMISYDSPRTVDAKVEYLKGSGLGGAMWWETSGDRSVNGSDGKSLIHLAVENLRSDGLEAQENWLGYSASQYDNLKRGMPGE